MLTLVCLGAEQVGTVHLPHLVLFQVGLQHMAQVTDQET